VVSASERESDAAVRKRAIFEAMSARGQRAVVKRGYENWDPFQEPKDPIDIRRDKTRRTTQMLVREFLQQRGDASYSNLYGQAVLEMALGIVNDDDRYRAMFEFSSWYRDLLTREGIV
jgi:hypothetical protein